MSIMLALLLCVATVQSGKQLNLIPDERAVKMRAVSAASNVAIVFKENTVTYSKFFEKNLVNVKLTPRTVRQPFNRLKLGSELVLPLKPHRNGTSALVRIVASFVVLDKFTGEPTVVKNIDNRTVLLDHYSVESIFIPPVSETAMESAYVAVNIEASGNNRSQEGICASMIDTAALMLLLSRSGYTDATSSEEFQPKNLNDDQNLSPCRRVPLWVNFRQVGWGAWIMAPREMNIYQCIGTCDYYESTVSNSTGNAIVRSLLKGMDKVAEPCCVPLRLSSASFLTRKNGKVVETEIKLLLVNECGCQ